MSIDGPGELHDKARGVKGTFQRTSDGLRRLQAAAKKKGAPLRVSINTTVAEQSLDTLEQMVDVAEELGVDAIGLNHLMFATAAERDETLRIIGETDPKIISTYITEDPGVDPTRVREKVARLQQACARKGVLFDYRPKVHPPLIDPYYTPGTPLAGRCLYPFMHARVSFSGKVFFCPFIRVEVGDLTTQTLGRGVERREVRRPAQEAARPRAVPRLPALLQGGAERAADAAGHQTRQGAAGDRAGRGARPGRTLSRRLMRTLLINPPPVNGIAFTRQGRCQEREEVLGTTKPPYSLLVCAALFRERSLPFRLIDQTAAKLSTPR